MVVRLLDIPFCPPPPAHRAARTVVPSVHYDRSSIALSVVNEPCRRRRNLSHVRSLVHGSNYRYVLFHDPHLSDRSRQGNPIRSTHRIPSGTFRGSHRGRPVAAGGGKTSAINAHSSLVKCKRAIETPSMATKEHRRQRSPFSPHRQIPALAKSLVSSGTEYWLTVANVLAGWHWADALNGPTIGSEAFNAHQSVGMIALDGGPHGGPWTDVHTDLAFRVHVIPEPSTLVLAVVGVALSLLAAAKRAR